jgi:MEDS: MEthanogen/methylotroph, DcmR Sensory domain
MGAAVRHRCIIYDGSPAPQLAGLATIAVEKLKANNRCLFLNSRPMVAGFRSYLAASGLDVEHEVEKGALVVSSDQSHLRDGLFDVDRMLCLLKEALDQALNDGYTALWATGDMTWELGGEKNFGKLLEYECQLEDLLQKHPALSGV